MPVQELLISSDSHVDVKPEQVKQRLASKFHEEYDAGVATLGERSGQDHAVEHAARAGVAPAAGEPSRAARPVTRSPRPGCATWTSTASTPRSSTARSAAFRYLYKMKEGWQEATRAFNDALHEFAAVDPKRLDRVVPDPDPRHRLRGAGGAARRRARRQVAAAPGVPARGRASPTTSTSATTRCGRDPGDRPADLLPHRPEHHARRPHPARPHAAERA